MIRRLLLVILFGIISGATFYALAVLHPFDQGAHQPQEHPPEPAPPVSRASLHRPPVPIRPTDNRANSTPWAGTPAVHHEHPSKDEHLIESPVTPPVQVQPPTAPETAASNAAAPSPLPDEQQTNSDFNDLNEKLDAMSQALNRFNDKLRGRLGPQE